jgi:hypothetical protein
VRNSAPSSELFSTVSRSQKAREKRERYFYLAVVASIAFSLTLVLAGCGGSGKRSCKLASFGQAPGSPLERLAPGSPFSAGTFGAGGAAVATADFNGDGYFDLVVPVETEKQLDADQGNTLETRNGLAILLGSGKGEFKKASSSPVQFPVKALPSHLSLGLWNSAFDVAGIDLVIGDFNGDGHPDLADVGGWPDQPISVLFGDGKGGFGNSKPAQRELAGGDRAFRVHTSLTPISADFNGDGNADIASAGGYAALNAGTGGLHIDIAPAKGYALLGDGRGGFKPASGSRIDVGDSPVAVATADFNGDHHPDLAFADRGNGVRVLLSEGTSTLLDRLSGDSTVRFGSAPGSPIKVGVSPSSIAVADFNKDGHADIAVSDAGAYDVTVLLGNGKGGFKQAPGSPLKVSAPPTSIAIGDFNGDGRDDVATVAYLSNGVHEWDNVTVLLGNGKGDFSQVVGSPYSTDKSSTAAGSWNQTSGAPNLVAADFNGDGRDDLAVSGSQRKGVTVLLARCR